MTRWRGPSDNGINRDRREISFAKAFIGSVELERRRREATAKAEELANRPITCCDGNDPACPTHGIAASNARQNDYWQRVDGHPDAGYMDGPDVERCIWCGDALSGNCEIRDEHYPYCSASCSALAEGDSRD